MGAPLARTVYTPAEQELLGYAKYWAATPFCGKRYLGCGGLVGAEPTVRECEPRWQNLLGVGINSSPVVIIREQQFAVFEAEQWRQFEQRVITHLRETFRVVLDKQQLAGPQLRQLIRAAVRRARSFKILSEQDVIRFIEYSLEYGDDFEWLPWAASILTAPEIAGDQKMDRLDRVTVFTVR
jgi:hypothetical protein